MKVDKGVCTNDAYFATNNATELNSIIKFETVFTTLVENKILSIKRECEQHENTKKSRTLKNLLLRKAELSDASKPNASSSGGNAEVSKDAKKTRKNIFLRYKNKKLCGADIDVEKGQVPDITATDVIQPSTSNEIVNVEYRNEVQQEAADNAKLSTANLDSQSNQLGLDEVSINFPVSKTIDENHDYANDDDDKRNCDKLIINSHTENAQLTLSTNSSVNNSNKNHATPPKETSPPSATTTNEESLATTIDISLQQQSSIIVVGAFNTPDKTPINASHQVNNEKSDLAICDDGASSQNTSDIEFSLVSENSISELPAQHIRKKTTNNSDPIVKKSLNLLSPPMVRGDRKTSERKAISCQSTPLFGRHQQTQTKSEGNEAKKVLTFQTEFPKKVSESKPPNIIEKAKSQTIVIAPTSSTTTTTLAPSGPAETVHLCKKSQKHSKYRDVSVDYEITYGDDGNQSPRGFISSFNQLTSQMTPAAVITTNPKKQSLKQSKTKDSREQQEAFVKTDDKTVKNHEPELELDDLAVDVVNKKKKRRSECDSYIRNDGNIRSLLMNLFIFYCSRHFQDLVVVCRILLFILHQLAVLNIVFSADHPINPCKFCCN